ncbi:hypothetical protein L1278_002461 [Pontibacter sp. HSC-36F09]|nr:hypothetical protein [Pontibacter sp. HSC-36F09]
MGELCRNKYSPAIPDRWVFYFNHRQAAERTPHQVLI